MGNIASPRLNASPLGALARIWGGELPTFDSERDLQEVVSTLVQGLWNRLADHQSSRDPFYLTRFEVLPTRQALHHLAVIRAQELQGFIDGLFGSEEEMRLPQKAHDAVQALSEVYSMFSGPPDLLENESKPATQHELKDLLRNFQKLTITADELINKAAQSCKRARGLRLDAMCAKPFRRGLRFGQAEVASQMPEHDDGYEPESIESALSQQVTRHGVSVSIQIYGDGNGKWILEVVDAENTSHVWDDPFESDGDALAEAMRALEEETLEFWGAAAERPMN
ncbi:hypothetical protein [Hydrogenophaga sp. BPS33]|uniref:hypothetical protein n=1 Tax=Hydrogenophaga sp. BPS33 TaxID=2651974 RepID=UPI001F326251|nr:hypothetical protein [Hydrogenophaga sp. BPS33]